MLCIYVALHTDLNEPIKVLVHTSQKIMFGVVTSLMGNIHSAVQKI